MNVLHVTTGMGRGGSESMLARLVVHSDPAIVRHHVLALSDEGRPWQAIQGTAASLLNLRLDARSLALPRLGRLPGFVVACKADVIQGWMYHGNYFASWVRRLFSKSSALILGIRQSLYDIGHERQFTKFVIRRGAVVSRRAEAVLYNSSVSRAQHEAIGYRTDASVVIPNGFDMAAFRPDAERRAETRLRLGLTDSDFVAAIVGRYHPIKDHATFVTAAAIFARSVPRAKMLIAGPGCNAENTELQAVLRRCGGDAKFQLLGDWPDTSHLYPALDALCLTSLSEGFPNVIGEAMSCGIPCVATAVGDIPELVGSCEWLVAPGDAKGMAERLVCLAYMETAERSRMGEQARARIEREFGIGAVLEKYLQLYARTRENPRRKLSLKE